MILNTADYALLNDLVIDAAKRVDNRELKLGYASLSQKLHIMHENTLSDASVLALRTLSSRRPDSLSLQDSK